VAHPRSNAFLLCMNKQWDTKHGLALLGLHDMSCPEKSPGRFVCIKNIVKMYKPRGKVISWACYWFFSSVFGLVLPGSRSAKSLPF
jgi:hypothetical protein